MKGLFTRTLSGVIYVAIIVGSLLCHEELVFSAVFAFITMLASFELLHIAIPDGKLWQKIFDIFGSACLFFGLPLAFSGMGFPAVMPFVAYCAIRLISQLYDKEENALISLSLSAFAQMYVALPFALLALIYNFYGPMMVLAVFVFLWLNDTGAYCVGCTLGKHRLFERISPKKSWEGFWGGLGLCMIVGALIGIYAPELGLDGGVAQWIVLAVVVSVFGTWGDLCESMIKRTIGVKDSGKIIPGHGGILDRIDSLLIATPAALIFLYYFFA